MRMIHTPLIATLFASLLFCPLKADDWPQWRGADLKSVSGEDSVPAEWNKEKNLLWRVPMPGPAGSSPCVSGSNVFVTSVEDEALVLMCIGTEGKIRWKKNFNGVNENSRDAGNSASPSPSTDGEHVWAMMGNGELVCYTVDGDLVWEKSLQNEYGKFNIQFGMSSTPILDNGNLYLQLMHGNMRDRKTTSVGQVIALDAKSGKQIWLHLRKTDGVAENKHSYASPTIYRDSDREFLVTHGADYVIGHSLADGSELWRCGGFNPKGGSYNPYLRLVASPSCGEGIIVVPTAKRGPVLGLKVDVEGNVTGNKESLHWKIDKGTPDVSTPVIHDGLVYLAGEKGDLSIVDAETGDVVLRKRLYADKQRATPVVADGKVFIADRKGTVYVLEAGREGKVLSKNELGEETTASPAIANGRVYIRTFDALYAFGEK